jgi:hypothetical protein
VAEKHLLVELYRYFEVIIGSGLSLSVEEVVLEAALDLAGGEEDLASWVLGCVSRKEALPMLKGASPSQYLMTTRERLVRKRWFILNIGQ